MKGGRYTEVVRQWLILACALMLGAAVPARAWCEVTCGAPATESRSHCPTHDPADGSTTLSASLLADCPVLESARPTVPVRLDVHAIFVRAYVPSLTLRINITPSLDRSPHPATVFERCTPLRI